MSLSLRIHTQLDDIPAADWDILRADDNPFLSHAFLSGLEACDCVRNELGWQPWHLAWYRDDRLVAALPAYLKSNSHGEFVFDWSWAQAYELAGGRYYPKLICAVPYTPVVGSRFLTGRTPNPALERVLAESLMAEARRLGLSSAHINFPRHDEAQRLDCDNRWLARCDVQFHWQNRGYANFEDFLTALNHKKRKNIRQERDRLHAAGWRFERLAGGALDDRGWQFVHALYVRMFAEKGNYPALSEAFFRYLGRALGDRTMVVLARAPDGRPVAMALFLQDGNRLYGRYWGCLQPTAGLHFECCYYQGIEHAIEHGLDAFEPGAQGEHKLARGFLPVLTRSYHYLCDADLHDRVDHSLRHERAAISEWYDELIARTPYAHAAD